MPIKEFCPSCGIENDGSKDNRVTFDNGSFKCFACGDYGRLNQNTKSKEHKPKMDVIPDNGRYITLTDRGISKHICKEFGVFQATVFGKQALIFPWGSKAQKIRFYPKETIIAGSWDDAELFGESTWTSSADSLVVTEGELDAMHCKEILDSYYNVTTIPSASMVAQWVKKFYNKLVAHKFIVLCIDNDGPGQTAVELLLQKLPLGKVKLVTLSEKDACKMHQAGKDNELKWAIIKAQSPLHSSVINFGDIKYKQLTEKPTAGVMTPFPELNKVLRGLRPKELTLLLSGAGVGKTTFCKYLIRDLLSKGKRVACIFLEEDWLTSTYYFAGWEYNIDPLDLIDGIEVLPEDKFTEITNKYRDKLYLVKDEFGGIGSKSLHDLLDYYANVMEVDFIFFDHITIAIMGSDETDDAVKEINRTITKMRELCERTSVHIVCVAHLRKVQNGSKAWEAGRVITRADASGAGALSQVPDNVIAIMGNLMKQSIKNIRQIKLLKGRKARQQEVYCDKYSFDPESTRILIEGEFDEVEDE